MKCLQFSRWYFQIHYHGNELNIVWCLYLNCWFAVSVNYVDDNDGVAEMFEKILCDYCLFEKSWTSAWSAHEVVATSYWHLGSLLGRETIGSDREASTTKFYCKTLSCWSWLWLRSIHGSISVVCGIGNVVRLSYPAWGHSWTACGHSWTAYGWSWRSDQYNHSQSLIGLTFTFSYISRYAYFSVYISLSFNDMSIYTHELRATVPR